MKPVFKLKRVYDKPTPGDGLRVLVDRLWPRGISKSEASIDEWAKDLAPSTELRQWFGHQPERWLEFKKHYTLELKKNEAVADFIENHHSAKIISLIYAAKDKEHT